MCCLMGPHVRLNRRTVNNCCPAPAAASTQGQLPFVVFSFALKAHKYAQTKPRALLTRNHNFSLILTRTTWWRSAALDMSIHQNSVNATVDRSFHANPPTTTRWKPYLTSGINASGKQYDALDENGRIDEEALQKISKCINGTQHVSCVLRISY